MRNRKSPYPSPLEPISLFRARDSQTPRSTPDVCVGSVSFLPTVGNLLSWAAAATGRGAPLAEGPGGGPALRLAGVRALASVVLAPSSICLMLLLLGKRPLPLSGESRLLSTPDGGVRVSFQKCAFGPCMCRHYAFELKRIRVCVSGAEGD